MVAGHASIEGGSFTHWLHDFIYTFHMPFFMIVSGYLFSDNATKDPKGYAKRKFTSLIIPFVTYNIALILLNNVFWHIGIINSDYTFYGSSWQEYTAGEIVRKILLTCFTFQDPEWTGLALWYLKDLFLVAVLFLLLLKVKIIRQYIRWLPVVLMIMATLMPGITIPVIGVRPDRILCELFLYSIGYNMKDMRLSVNIWIVLGCLILTLASPFLFNFVELRYPNGIIDKPRYLLVGIAGFIWFMAVCNKMVNKRFKLVNTFMAYISKNAIIIIALHVLVFKVVTFVLSGLVSAYNVVPQTESNIMWSLYTLIGIGIVLILNVAIIAIEKKFRTVLNIEYNGKKRNF